MYLSHQRQTNWHTVQPLRTRDEYAALSVDIHVLCEGIAQRIVFSRQMYIWPDPIEIFPLVSHFEVRRPGRVYEPEEQNEHPNQFHHAYRRKLIDDLGRDTDRHWPLIRFDAFLAVGKPFELQGLDRVRDRETTVSWNETWLLPVVA